MENHFSTTRKAVEQLADKLAEPEKLAKPRIEHFEMAFDMLRTVKDTKVELFDQLVNSLAAFNDLKKEMGVDLYVFTETVLNELYNKHKQKIEIKAFTAGITNQGSVFETNVLETQKETVFNEILNEILDSLFSELSQDTRILKAFSDKNELLKKWIDTCKLHVPKITAIYSQLEEI